MPLDRDFEKFKGGPVVATRDRPHVTLSSLGVIYLNQAAYRVLSRPPAVSLYYSSERDCVAIEPADPRRPESFPVKQCQNGYRILAGPFVGHFRLRTDHTIRFLRPDLTDSGGRHVGKSDSRRRRFSLQVLGERDLKKSFRPVIFANNPTLSSSSRAR
jgi:hypothetical protein